ncbi:MAG: hypothetical protein QOI74_1490 [Micromonosporaceae bacterium]|jgi:hypothetical protein|nr:hypothetical protein [Micromonosporaceae bacterium]MDT5037684.1 hypothetical protein [Micromonosporaceae bacterium]
MKTRPDRLPALSHRMGILSEGRTRVARRDTHVG